MFGSRELGAGSRDILLITGSLFSRSAGVIFNIAR
jgi:hypothetical protein